MQVVRKHFFQVILFKCIMWMVFYFLNFDHNLYAEGLDIYFKKHHLL